VTAIGDSVMLASAAALEASMPGVYINAHVGTQMQDGLAVAQNLAADGRLRPIVVVGLGTNGTITVGQIRQLRRAIGPRRDLVLINTYGPRSWEPGDNAVLAAASRGRHTRLADWHDAIAARTYLLWPDGIHPRPDGAKLYAHIVLAAIRSLPARCR
jgi:lysophospholipase L1-like esterase